MPPFFSNGPANKRLPAQPTELEAVTEPECLLSFSMQVRSLSPDISVQARVRLRVILYLCCDAAAGGRHVKFAVTVTRVTQWNSGTGTGSTQAGPEWTTRAGTRPVRNPARGPTRDLRQPVILGLSQAA